MGDVKGTLDAIFVHWEILYFFAKPRVRSKKTNGIISKAKTKLEVGFRILEQIKNLT